MTRPRAWLTLLGLAMSAVAVALLLRSIDAADTWRRLRETRLHWFLGACFVTTLSYGIRAVRWGVLLPPARRPRFGRLFAATMVGFLAINTLPARLGELVRAYTLSRSSQIPTATVLGSVAVERILDLAALGLFWALSLGVTSLPAWYRWSGLVTLGLMVLATAGLWAMHRFGGAGFHALEERLLRRLPERSRRALAGAIPAFFEGVRGIARPPVLAQAALLTAAVWVVSGAVFLMAGAALDMHLPVWAPLLLAFVVCVGIMVPSSPGFVGVMEAACVAGLGLTGFHGAQALAYGVLYHATQLVPLILLGAWYAAREHVGGEILRGIPETPPAVGERIGDTDAGSR